MNKSISSEQLPNGQLIKEPCYRFGDTMIHKQDIAMNLATEGFRFVAFEQQWSDNLAGNLFNQLGDINDISARLTDADCQEFIKGLEQSFHDGEMLYQHVTSFTRKMLKKWSIEQNHTEGDS